MNLHRLFVLGVGLCLAGPASLKAAVGEEWKNVELVERTDLETSTLDLEAVTEAMVEPSPEAEVAPAAPAASPAIQNHIHIQAAQAPPWSEPKPAAPAVASVEPAALAYSSQASTVMQTRAAPAPDSESIAITPMVGASLFQGAWGQNIRNQYSLGLALEFPLSRHFAFEVEGGYANHRVAYTPDVGPAVGYAFNQYTLGGNGKVYLMTTKLRPYLGGGLTAVFYENMWRSTGIGAMRVPYDQIIGAANLMAGLEFQVSDSVSIGARGAYLIPVINLPGTFHNGITSAPGFEETSAIQTSFYRLMGTVSVRL